MRREDPDYFKVEPQHRGIHHRLENWSRWVTVTRFRSKQHPMWAKTMSNARQWHAPEIRDDVDLLDAQRIEKAVAMLPQKERDALRWAYVFRYGELRARKELGVTKQGLMELLHRGRQFLINRLP